MFSRIWLARRGGALAQSTGGAYTATRHLRRESGLDRCYLLHQHVRHVDQGLRVDLVEQCSLTVGRDIAAEVIESGTATEFGRYPSNHG